MCSNIDEIAMIWTCVFYLSSSSSFCCSSFIGIGWLAAASSSWYNQHCMTQSHTHLAEQSIQRTMGKFQVNHTQHIRSNAIPQVIPASKREKNYNFYSSLDYFHFVTRKMNDSFHIFKYTQFLCVFILKTYLKSNIKRMSALKTHSCLLKR